MRTKIMLGLLVLVLSILNYAIYQKEQIKTHGKTLLFEIASCYKHFGALGECLKLNYILTDDLRKKISESQLPTYGNDFSIVIQPNEEGVVQFVRFYQGESLKPNERILKIERYGCSPYNWTLTIPRDFPLAGDDATDYKNAKYAVLKFDDSGNHLLTGLLDANKEQIVVPAP